MIRDQLIRELEYAVENEKTIVLNVSFGENTSCGVSVMFELYRYDAEDDEIILYHGTDLYIICTKNATISYEDGIYSVYTESYRFDVEFLS